MTRRRGQVPYNLLWRSVEAEVVPLCQQEDVGILAYSPLMAGLLSGKYTDPAAVPEGRQRTKHFNHTRTDRCYHEGPGAETETFSALAGIQSACDKAGVSMVDGSLGWLLAQPTVKSLVVGATSPEQMQRNCSQFAVRQPGFPLPSNISLPANCGLCGGAGCESATGIAHL